MENINRTTVLALSTHSPLPATENRSLNKEAPSAETDEPNTENQVSRVRAQDANMDPKKLRRVLASRQYSQKYRLKQLQYIVSLETEVKALQAEVAITAPRIKYVDRQNSLLRVENSSMKHKLSAFSGELMFKEAQYEELKKERDFLKQGYVVNQMPLPEFFKSKSAAGTYQYINQSWINPFMEPAVGVQQTMMDQNLNQFGPGQN